jgi:hypothetical protein
MRISWDVPRSCEANCLKEFGAFPPKPLFSKGLLPGAPAATDLEERKLKEKVMTRHNGSLLTSTLIQLPVAAAGALGVLMLLDAIGAGAGLSMLGGVLVMTATIGQLIIWFTREGGSMMHPTRHPAEEAPAEKAACARSNFTMGRKAAS